MPRAARRPLAVLLHAWVGAPDGLGDVAATLRQRYPAADLLTPAYPAQWHSSADPAHLAARLADQIARAYDPAKHDEVLPIGHSLGGLLLAKAFCYAAGATREIPAPLRARAPLWRPWARAVRRIICFAGLLRGWSLPWAGRQYPLPTWLALRTAAALAPATLVPFGAGRLIFRARHTSPFVRRLAVQWASLARANRPMPPVTQLHGTRDALLAPSDIRGPTNATIPPIRYLSVEAAGHEDIVTLSADPRRREAFLAALD